MLSAHVVCRSVGVRGGRWAVPCSPSSGRAAVARAARTPQGHPHARAEQEGGAAAVNDRQTAPKARSDRTDGEGGRR